MSTSCHGVYAIMDEVRWNSVSADALLAEFFSQDDIKSLTADAGTLLECPLLVLGDTFRVVAHYRPLGFSDPVFSDAVRQGEITYEIGALISQSEALRAGTADYVKLDGSAYRRRIAPLTSAGVGLGFLVCIDTDGHLKRIPPEVWQIVEQIFAKQMFIEASRHDKPFETEEDILMHLLDGGFQSAPYFRLQTANTYLADFTPTGFALIDLTAYHGLYHGLRRLRDDLSAHFPDGHQFLYRGDVFLFLHGRGEREAFSALADEFKFKVIMSEGLDDLFALPALYKTAHEALELMMDNRFHGSSVCTVAQLRTAVLLKNVEDRHDLVSKEIRTLAEHDRKKGTQYCETLYYYLTCNHSLKMTCDALFTHRNTILYRIRRMQEDYLIPLDDPAAHTDLLFGVSLVLFEEKGPDFFCINAEEKTANA